MKMIETLISLLAPHTCLACGIEGSPLCCACAQEELSLPGSSCLLCSAEVSISQLCPECACNLPYQGVFIACAYAGPAKDLIKLLKYGRGKAAARDIAREISRVLPVTRHKWLVVPVPTANKRVRARGYDQAVLIAGHLSKQLGLPCEELLRRKGSTRQVGAGRNERLAQLKTSFYVTNPDLVRNSRILLVDDVITTGATIEAAALALQPHTPLSVEVAAFAH